VAFAALLPRWSSAQAIAYYDFNTPEANPSETLTNSCTPGTYPATSGVLLCLNYATAIGDTDGFSFISDSSYTSSINPDESSTTNYALQFTGLTQNQASSMWYSIPQNVANGFNVWYAVKLTYSSEGTSASFTNCCTADGIAFVIQNAAGGQTDSITSTSETGSGFTVLGGGGGAIGYGGIDNSVALEMDTFYDSQWDPEDNGSNDDNHMALQSCGPGVANSPAHLSTPNCLITLGSGASQISTLVSDPKSSATSSVVTLADGNPHQVVIIYNGPNDAPANYIYVYLDPAFNPGTHTPVAGSVPLFSGPFDITKYINLNNGTAYVGFTAANGFNFEQHELMGFSFTPHNYASANVCPTGATTPAPCSSTLPVTFSFAASTTIGSIQVVTQGAPNLDFTLGSGSTCSAGTITAGNSCTVNVTFAPIAPGLRLGAVNLLDGGSNVLATQLIYGLGQGPAAAFIPGTPTTVNTGTYSFNAPKGVAVDAAGDVFIVDTGDHTPNHNVVKVAANGTVSVVASGLSYPQGLAVDGAGDLFIADNDRNEVVKVTPDGTQTTVGSGLVAQLGVAVDGTGDVFIADFFLSDTSTSSGQVVEIPAGCTTSACQTVVYSPASGFHPIGLAVDAAGDLFIAVFSDTPITTPGKVVEIPAGCTSSGCQTTVGTGWSEPEAAAVDAAGDLFVADEGSVNPAASHKVVEVPPGCTSSTCEIAVSGVVAYGVALDGKGNIFIPDLDDTPADNTPAPDPYSNHVIVINRAQPSLSFANTTVGSTSTDSPQSLGLQNIGNQTLTGSLALNLGANFTQNLSSDCSGAFPLAQGAICSESFSFEPLSSGPLTGTAVFTDNALNAAPATQTIALSGVGVPIVPTTVAVPNVVGQTQDVATTSIDAASLVLGTVSTQSSSSVPLGSVISESPMAGTVVNLGSAVNLVVSSGVQASTPNPLTLQNNYFVTGDYVSAGVSLRGTGAGGMATGAITIASSPAGGNAGVPDGADILAAYVYWETLEDTPSASGGSGTFRGYSITGQQIGTDQPNPDGSSNGTLRVYRADVNAYLPVGANGIRYASGSHSVSLPDSGGNGFPLAEGASLVVIYRVLSPNFPLKAVVIYDGSAVPTGTVTQNVAGFYDALAGANPMGELTNLFATTGGWNTSSSSVAIPADQSQYTATLNPGDAYAAVILSTPVTNSDNDGILDAWKAGPGAGDFHTGQPGYYDAKTGSWVPLPGAAHGEKDLFVQLDYMCGTVNPDGSCSGENLFPSPDANGNDPLAMVQQAFGNNGVHLHLEIGNAVPEDPACTDNGSQLCEFPNQSGVISWKNSLEFSKLWPRNLADCASGGDCTARFPYGQKDSYHYVLFGHSLAIPAWNTRYGTLVSINVSGGVTTIVTADRGSGINACPSRITISGVIGNPSLNGVYNTATCADTKTITVDTPGVPPWSYPTGDPLPEPIIGLTSGTITSISGYSDLGGSDSAVTLGLWLTAPNQDMSKRANVIAGTLFHEIGHTIGLTHGGLYYDTSGNYVPTFEANCKPNYQSSMNYLFQLDGVGPNQAVAYSNQTLTTLDEDTAGSVTQLTDRSNAAATFSTSAWYVPYVSGVSTASPATLHCDGTPLTGAQAYRVNAPIAPITPPWTNGQDINFDGQDNTQMRGYNDWANIDLRQVGATGGEFASLASVLSFGTSAPQNIGAGGMQTLGSGGTVTLGSGGTVTLGSGGNVTLSNGGTVALGSGGTVTLGSGGTVTLGSGGTVTPSSSGTIALGSGGTVTINGSATITDGGTTTQVPSTGGIYSIGSGGTVTLGSGGTVTLGSGGTVTLGSGGTVTLGSGGTVTLGSGGTVTLGSGGTVTLGSGGTVTLGSGGTVTLGSGGTVTLGSGGASSGGTLALGSGGTVTLGSGGTVTLGSGGDVTLGTGGTVTLGSGGTIALGSGGTVTLGSGGTVTLGSGGTITLGGGGTSTVVGPGTYDFSAGGTITLGSGGTIALGSGGTVTLGSGGTVTLGSGGTVTLGSGGAVTLGSGGTVTLGSGGITALGGGGTVTLGSGGTVTLGSGGTVTLGSGGTVTLGSGGTVTLGSGGATTTELTYETANSIVRPPSNPTETPVLTGVRIDWKAPAFGVIQSYTIYRSSNGGTPIVIGTVTGNPPATEFIDTNPDTTSATVVYTIGTNLAPDTGTSTSRQSPPSPPAVLKNNQTITLGPLPVSALVSGPQPTVTATAMSNGSPNGLTVSFSTTGPCTVGNPLIANGVSSATVALNGTGTCTIIAAQTGATTYNAATSVSGSFPILPQSQAQAITFTTNPPTRAAYKSSFTVAATGGASGNPVIFTSSGACSLSGTTVSGATYSATYTMTNSTGTCSVIASQAGNSNYAPVQATRIVTATGPLVTVSPSNIAFGTVYQGSITTKTITVTNTGNAPATINQPLLSIVKGGNSNEFVAVNLCLVPLAAGKSCTITIAFVAGPFYTAQTATLQIMNNAPGSPQPVTMSALVIDPLASFSPTSLNFGTVKRTTSSTLNVTLSNPGGTPLIFAGTGISVTGTNAKNFAPSNNCGISLAPGAKCTIAVKFTPPTAGTFSANLTVVDNAQAGGGTQTVPLSGKGN
jgi:hypothetical protein